MNYFICNLPDRAPHWMHPAATYAFTQTVRTIRDRMDVLELAYEMSGLTGETFAKYAKQLFDNCADTEGKFDTLSAETIANYAISLDDGTVVPPRMEWPNAITVVDTAFVSRHEWESLRHIGIGGSDAAVATGHSPYETQRGLYHNKIGSPEAIPAPDASAVFDRGHIMESRVVQAFCNLPGAVVIPETRMFASKTHPNCTANIDAIVYFPSTGKYYVFEAKTTVLQNWAAWVNEKVPAHYIPQTRQYPAVLNDDRIAGTYIGCLFVADIVVGDYYVASDTDERSFKCVFIERDKDVELAQLEAETEFFENYIESNIVPPLTGSPEKEQEVRLIFSGLPSKNTAKAPVTPDIWDKSDKAVVDEYMQYANELKELEAKAKVVKSSRDTAAQKIRDRLALGNGCSAECPVDDTAYFEIKDSPRSRTTIDEESLHTLIDSITGMVPDEIINAMNDCFDPEGSKFSVLSVKEKVRKTA